MQTILDRHCITAKSFRPMSLMYKPYKATLYSGREGSLLTTEQHHSCTVISVGRPSSLPCQSVSQASSVSHSTEVTVRSSTCLTSFRKWAHRNLVGPSCAERGSLWKLAGAPNTVKSSGSRSGLQADWAMMLMNIHCVSFEPCEYIGLQG